MTVGRPSDSDPSGVSQVQADVRAGRGRLCLACADPGADIASAEGAWPLHCGRNRADRLLRFLYKAVRRTDAAASVVVVRYKSGRGREQLRM